jgi:hypothetical protein
LIFYQAKPIFLVYAVFDKTGADHFLNRCRFFKPWLHASKLHFKPTMEDGDVSGR